MKKDIDIEKLKEEIVERLKPLNPYKIILFGSYAHGNPDEDSDIDLYIVTNDDFVPKNYDEKMKTKLKVSKALDSIRDNYPLDLVVHTKKMNQRFLMMDSSFSREVLENGEVLK